LIILPEIILSVGFLILLSMSPFIKTYSFRKIGYLSLFLIFITQFFIVKDIFIFEEVFNGFFIIDSFGSFLKLIILISAGLIIFFYLIIKNEESLKRPEFPLVVLLSLIGMLLMVSANNLLSLFVSIELQSLGLYVLVSFSKEDLNSSEAGVKYFVIGSLSTCIFLFGASLIYGLVGSTDFSIISNYMSDQPSIPMVLIVGLIFILVSISLKISAAPFHMWTPDVYQGAPTIVTAFLSTAPKVAVFGVLIRLLVFPFGEIIVDWGKIVIILSITSMIIGSLGAIMQNDIKRLMAYSTINHIGFMLMGLVPGSEDGITAISIYLILYLTMNLGVFLFILNMQRDQINVTSIKDLSGLYKTEPVMAGSLAIILFSMAGIPPLAGFVGKLLILNVVIDSNLILLATIAVLTSVIAAFYYLRLIKSIFFDSPSESLDALTNNQSRILMLTFSFFNLTVILYPKFFLNLSASIALSLFALK
jgi:NADH-quinone oxidoreductase subunit N